MVAFSRPTADFAPTAISALEVERCARAVGSWTSTQPLFPSGIQPVGGWSSPCGGVRLCLRNPCPYAAAGHADGDAHLDLYVRRDRRACRFVCSSGACARSLAHDFPWFHADDIKRATLHADEAAGPTLHQQADAIDWAEDYDEPAMRPYPETESVAVVCGGMGLGKTVALDATVAALPPGATALVVTSSRSLALKAHGAYARYGFANYQNTSGPLTDERVIVCSDSLHRVDRDAFDLVVMDEAFSTLQHFNSTLMERREFNVQKLQQLLSAEGRVIMLDAAADTTLLTNVVGAATLLGALRSFLPDAYGLDFWTSSR